MRPIPLAAALALAATSAILAGPPALVDLALEERGGEYVASARLVDGLSPQAMEEIDAGIETTLRYRLQLYLRRPGLPDDPLVRRQVECGVRRDGLSRQYTLTRRVDGELAERRVTTDAAEMRVFLTTLPAIPLGHASELPSDGAFYLRARCEMGLVWRFYLIPWRLNTDWARVDLAPRENGHAAGP